MAYFSVRIGCGVELKHLSDLGVFRYHDKSVSLGEAYRQMASKVLMILRADSH